MRRRRPQPGEDCSQSYNASREWAAIALNNLAKFPVQSGRFFLGQINHSTRSFTAFFLGTSPPRLVLRDMVLRRRHRIAVRER